MGVGETVLVAALYADPLVLVRDHLPAARAENALLVLALFRFFETRFDQRIPFLIALAIEKER
jgi:hypothetical protein